MSYPTFHKGDVVRIESGYSYLGNLTKYQGELAVVTELTGKKRRAKGSIISYGLYRVFIPKHNVYRTARARYLSLASPVPGKKRYGEGGSVEVLYEVSPQLKTEISSLLKGHVRPRDSKKRYKGPVKGRPGSSGWRNAILRVLGGRANIPPRGGW